MARSLRKHSPEFKREAVRLSREPGRTVAEVAANLGIDRSLLQSWRGQMEAHGAEAFPGNGRLKSSDEEVAQLRKDLARAQQERDIRGLIDSRPHRPIRGIPLTHVHGLQA